MSAESTSIARAMACNGCGCALNCAVGADLYRLRCAACVAREAAQPEIRPEQVSASIARARSVTLALPYPISANRYWATRIITPKGSRRPMALTYVTPEAKQYRDDVAKLAIAAGVRPLAGRVCVELHLYPHRPLDWAKRARKDPDYWADTVQCIDLGNAEKVLSDALNGIAWEDDKQHHEIHKYREDPDEHGARVVVTISPMQRERIAPELPL